MVWAASTIIALGSAAVGAYGAYSSSQAAGDASQAQQQAASDATAEQRRQYDQTRTDQAPYRDAGAGALGQITAGTQPGGQFARSFGKDDFQADPGYQFRMDEGMKGITNSAAARGGLLSGAALKASATYNQNFASNEFGNAYNRFNTNQTNGFNRLASVAGIGQMANNQVQQAGTNMANNVSGNMLSAGSARSSGYIAQGNALTGALGQGANALQQWGAMNGPGTMNNAMSYANPYTSQGADLNALNGAGSKYTGL